MSTVGLAIFPLSVIGVTADEDRIEHPAWLLLPMEQRGSFRAILVIHY